MTGFLPRNEDISALGAFFAALLCILFGANAVAIKISFAGMGVFTTAALRFTLAAVLIYLWTRVTGRSLQVREGQIPSLLIIGAFFTLQMSLLYIGLDKTNVSRATLLTNLQPFFVLFLAHFFIRGDRINKRKIFGLFLGFTGVAFVFLEKKGVTEGFRAGDLLILTASFTWACQAVYVKRIIHAFDTFQIVLYPMIFSVPFFSLGSLAWDHTMITRLDQTILAALLYQSLIAAALGFVLWNGLLQKYGAVSLHSFIFIMPIAGVLLGGFILGEPISVKILAALALITSGILVIHYRRRPASPILLPGR